MVLYILIFTETSTRRLTTLPPSCAVVMKSWTLNFLEPGGPLQACNATALPLPLHLPLPLYLNLYTCIFG